MSAVPARWVNGSLRPLCQVDLDALPSGTTRLFELRPGIRVALAKCPDGTWRVLTRAGIHSRALSGLQSASRSRLSEPEPDGSQPKQTPHVAAMQRIATATR